MTNFYAAFLVAIAVGLGLGVLGRRALRSRVRLSLSDALLAGIAGAATGATVAGIGRALDTSLPVISGLVAVAGTVVVLLAMERWQAARRVPGEGAAALIRAGESGKVEFKSSARFNRHTEQRDERLERVIVKTVAGFLNSEGGVLLIGVADDGSICGIEDDYRFMKEPDRDRYELWLRDLLITSLGGPAASLVRVEFEGVDDHDVCVVRVSPSSRPVFLRAAKGETGATFVARIGNSTRELPVDEALAYASTRWGARTLSRHGG